MASIPAPPPAPPPGMVWFTPQGTLTPEAFNFVLGLLRYLETLRAAIP